MKIHIFHEKNLAQNYVELHYGKLDDETITVKNFLGSLEKSIVGKNRDEEKERLIKIGEILYLEVVDRKCFVYLSDSEWRTDMTIQGFLEICQEQGFVRVSKSTVVNVHRIKELKAGVNMRIHILLDNGETVVLNRNYRADFLRYLENLRQGGLSHDK